MYYVMELQILWNSFSLSLTVLKIVPINALTTLKTDGINCLINENIFWKEKFNSIKK